MTLLDYTYTQLSDLNMYEDQPMVSTKFLSNLCYFVTSGFSQSHGLVPPDLGMSSAVVCELCGLELCPFLVLVQRR